ncbi:MAG TPA: cytochrome c, partial [Pyrinomonadaceae bacterium]|nr:cytochrome c [Pyrinomonadaceae bacterium]
MADTPESGAIVKREDDAPERDPIVSRSTSGWMLVSALVLIGTLAWALYDEAYGQRPWKGAQQEFVGRYTRYLKSIRADAGKSEAEVKESAEYQTLAEEAKAAEESIAAEFEENTRKIKVIDDQLAAVTDPFQNARGQITVVNYQIETARDSKKDGLRQKVAQMKDEKSTVYLPADDGSGKTTKQELNYTQLEALYNKLKDDKAELLDKNGKLLKEPTELRKKRDEYLRDHMIGLTPAQIGSIIRKYEEGFDYTIKQINASNGEVVDRCETCHLGVREPLTIKASDLAPDGPGKKPDEWARAFVSHPSKELLTIHNPDRFGCAGCHGGNGRATTSVTKGHGRHRFWLHPLYERENMEAGCQQCHTQDRVLQGAKTLNLGKDLFQNRGCVGCHRSEGFDRETDALAQTRQQIIQLEETLRNNEREARQAKESVASVTEGEEGDAEAARLTARAEQLTVANSLVAAQIDQLNIQARYLMQDQKKVGPNLKDVRLKLVKEWVPEWLRDPQTFRPGTKMPTFWRLNAEKAHDARADDDRKAIAAYLWQESFDGKMPSQDRARGNVANGKQLFETVGCMACHSVSEGEGPAGGNFAANLQRVGEKANFDYVVRWIYNPRIRWAPYCPKEKRDITREEYKAKNLAYLFDTEQFSTCPNDGAELQVQNMTVMPNFRLTIDEARDIASYLFSLSQGNSFRDAAASSYMDDPNLKERGRALIKQYGCAGCHEIKGFEEEQRIGKELTAEGSTPIERLDFALMTQKAEKGIDPEDPKKKVEEWYNHKGFFEHKLESPWIYDEGKEKEPQDRLRMPEPYLTPEWKNALTTFLMGSVGTEGANVPASLFYRPEDQRKAVQDGWWVIKKYNCMGCHSIQLGQRSVLMDLPLYQNPEWREQLPPNLTSEGARVDPNWLLRFLHDPSLSDERGGAEPGRSDRTVGTPAAAGGANNTQPATPTASPPASGAPSGAQGGAQGGAQNGGQQAGGASTAVSDAGLLAEQFRRQPGADRNGVRSYLRARMPTFNFSPNELRILVRFFMAVSAQQEPYIREPLEPLKEEEKTLARALFTSQGAPCLKCHITGDPVHDRTASAPNFLLASERLKPKWTYRWLLDPQQISPGTAMPSGLFKKEGGRMVFNGPTPEAFNNYHRDHAELLVRYMFQLTPDEQRRLSSGSPAATGGTTPA